MGDQARKNIGPVITNVFAQHIAEGNKRSAKEKTRNTREGNDFVNIIIAQQRLELEKELGLVPSWNKVMKKQVVLLGCC